MDTFKIKAHLPEDMESLLKGLFSAGSMPYELLKQALEREFRPHGAPEVKKMEIDRIKFKPAAGNGSFRVVLDIDYTFGCEDLLRAKKNETSEWTFSTNTEDGYIIFYSSPAIDSRSTADEF